MGTCTDSNYAMQYNLPGTFAPIADYELLESAVNTVREKGLTARVGNVFTSDVFYNDDPTVNDCGSHGGGNGSDSSLYECGQSW